MVLPLPDLPIINTLIPLGSRGDYIVCWSFHSGEIFNFHFYIYLFLNVFPIFKIYCLKCGCVTETENYRYCYIQKWQTNEAWSMYHMRKLRLNSSREMLRWNFLKTLVNKLPFEMHLPGHNITGPGAKLYRRLNPDGRQRSGVYR